MSTSAEFFKVLETDKLMRVGTATHVTDDSYGADTFIIKDKSGKVVQSSSL